MLTVKLYYIEMTVHFKTIAPDEFAGVISADSLDDAKELFASMHGACPERATFVTRCLGTLEHNGVRGKVE